MLKEIYEFHTTKVYEDNYKDTGFTPDKILLEIFGKRTELPENSTVLDFQLFQSIQRECQNTDLSGVAKEFLAYMDHKYKNSPETSEDNTTTKAQFPMAFAVMISQANSDWCAKLFDEHVKEYIQHREEDEKYVLKYTNDANKYLWKPKPVPFETSARLKDRFDYHQQLLFKHVSNFFADMFSRFLVFYHRSNRFLDQDFDFILTRPEESIKKAELTFFNTVFGLKKWAPCFSDLVLTEAGLTGN